MDTINDINDTGNSDDNNKEDNDNFIFTVSKFYNDVTALHNLLKKIIFDIIDSHIV